MKIPDEIHFHCAFCLGLQHPTKFSVVNLFVYVLLCLTIKMLTIGVIYNNDLFVLFWVIILILAFVLSVGQATNESINDKGQFKRLVEQALWMSTDD